VRSSFSLISLLIVVALIMLFFARKASHDMDAVRTVSLAMPQSAEPKPFDVGAAQRLAMRLRELLAVPELPTEELRQASAQADAWAAGARPGTPEHHMAVQIRSAAVELLAATTALDDAHRVAAKRFLDNTGSPQLAAPGSGPANPINGIRDQIQNLQNTQRQRYQETAKDAQ
jgi:hypothetical protein